MIHLSNCLLIKVSFRELREDSCLLEKIQGVGQRNVEATGEAKTNGVQEGVHETTREFAFVNLSISTR